MNTITDDQIAEIEALAKAACEYTQTDWFSPSDLSESLADEDARFVGAAGPFTVRALITRMREAERDAARYRWLKDQGHFRAMSMDMGGNHTWVGMGRCVGRGDTVDAAIDATMQEAMQ